MSDRVVRVTVDGGASYPVMLGKGVLGQAGALVRAHKGKVAVIADEKAAEEHLGKLLETAGSGKENDAACIFVPSGESSKSILQYERIVSDLLNRGFRRDSLIIAFGGGMVGDLAGFVAATLLRGVDFCQIPTTLLAQVDAAVGGKTGVNHACGKNLIGAIHQPKAVYCDPDVLDTLGEREYRSGIAEIVKYGLAFDAKFFSWIEANSGKLAARDSDALAYAIESSVRFKAKVVGEDELDRSGVRALLNLGHTFAHAIESAQKYDGLLHGEAVAIGLVAAGELSTTLLGLSEEENGRIRPLLQSFGLPVKFPRLSLDDLVSAMSSDKKFDAVGNNFVLLHRLGKACLMGGVEAPMIGRAIKAVGFDA